LNEGIDIESRYVPESLYFQAPRCAVVGRFGGKIASVILSGWKAIAQYLGIGIRTAERWEQGGGLPVHRPIPSRRSHVVANSQEIDSWLHASGAWRRHDLTLLTHLERARKLQAEARRARQTLKEKMEALRREVAAMHAAVQNLQRNILMES